MARYLFIIITTISLTQLAINQATAYFPEQQISESLTETFIEIGVGDGLENNTLFLLLKGWTGVWIDGDTNNIQAIQNKFSFLQDNGRLKTKYAWIDKDNIDSTLKECELTEEVDLLSIDIDGNDYHIFKNIISIKPRVIIIEYNAKLPPPVEWIMKYNPHHTKTNTDYFGASLKSFEYPIKILSPL